MKYKNIDQGHFRGTGSGQIVCRSKSGQVMHILRFLTAVFNI
jgi:hypothetical protein